MVVNPRQRPPACTADIGITSMTSATRPYTWPTLTWQYKVRGPLAHGHQLEPLQCCCSMCLSVAPQGLPQGCVVAAGGLQAALSAVALDAGLFHQCGVQSQQQVRAQYRRCTTPSTLTYHPTNRWAKRAQGVQTGRVQGCCCWLFWPLALSKASPLPHLHTRLLPVVHADDPAPDTCTAAISPGHCCWCRAAQA